MLGSVVACRKTGGYAALSWQTGVTAPRACPHLTLGSASIEKRSLWFRLRFVPVSPLGGPAAVCDRCGRAAIVEIEGQSFCAGCYQLPGSGCLEFGADDLWKEDQR
jgi:hypothetical protein